MKQNKVIVLRKNKLRESDLLLSTIDSSGSKVLFSAKGALRSRKRFGGGILEPLNVLNVYYKPVQVNKESSYIHLLEADLVREFSGIKISYKKLELAFRFLKTIDRVSYEGTTDLHNVFNLLGQALLCLDESTCFDERQSQRLSLHFDIKLLHFLGFLENQNNYLNFLKVSIQNYSIWDQYQFDEVNKISTDIFKQKERVYCQHVR